MYHTSLEFNSWNGFLLQGSDERFDHNWNTAIASIIESPAKENDCTIRLFPSIRKSKDFAWFQLAIKLKREEVIHRLYILHPLLLHTLGQDVISTVLANRF